MLDTDNATLFAVAKLKVGNGTFEHHMYAIDVATGHVLLDSGAVEPTVVTPSGNVWTLWPQLHKQAAGLVYWPGNAASGPLVIAGFASHCE